MQRTTRRIADSFNAFVATSPTPAPVAHHGALAGLSVAVKDTICTHDMPTTCASAMLRDFHPPYDATVVRLLRTAGADILGKTNCDEFGMGSLNLHSVHGPVINPRFASSPAHSAGGSSGGSAAAVAAGLCDAALGTDTGGSTRLPASYCGVVGLKPSYGLLSRWGVVSYADSLDCVGIFSRSVVHTHRIFDTLNTHDPKDPTSAPPQARERAATACSRRLQALTLDHVGPSSLRGLRIGVPQEYFPAELAPHALVPLRCAINALQARGADIVRVGMPATQGALSAYYVLASAEASSCLARFDGVRYGTYVGGEGGGTKGAYARARDAGFGREVKKRVLLGTYALSADAFDNYFLQARRVRALVGADFRRAFLVPDYRGVVQDSEDDEVVNDESDAHQRVDVLLHASAIGGAPALNGTDRDGLGAYVQDVLTVPASLAGVPAMSVPVGDSEVGVSVVGQWGCEEMVFGVGRAIEEVKS